MAASAADAEEDGVAAMLPLDLIKAEVIPPAPNRSASAADFLPDFAGLSWMAYGASSLLVVSHLPSPNSEDETAIGPVFRQVIEPPRGRSEDVKAVAWAPVMPSNGEVAAASGRDVRVYSSPVGDSNGTFVLSVLSVSFFLFSEYCCLEHVNWLVKNRDCD